MTIDDEFAGFTDANFAEYCRDREINSMLDHIKEEFFDDRFRAYKLSKMGLIQLIPYLKSDMVLKFMQHMKNKSIVIKEVTR